MIYFFRIFVLIYKRRKWSFSSFVIFLISLTAFFLSVSSVALKERNNNCSQATFFSFFTFTFIKLRQLQILHFRTLYLIQERSNRDWILSRVATSVLCMRLLHVAAFSKKLRWLAQTKIISLKTQLHAVNARCKRLSQRSFITRKTLVNLQVLTRKKVKK